jgi:acid stress-induced BolA-like protein IbaG/YrbA
MTPADLKALIESRVPGATATVQSDDQVHYEAVVVSDAFAGRRRIERHQMVYRALGDLMGGEVHALSIRALTPAEQSAGA